MLVEAQNPQLLGTQWFTSHAHTLFFSTACGGPSKFEAANFIAYT